MMARNDGTAYQGTLVVLVAAVCVCWRPSSAGYATIFSKEHFHDVVTKPGSDVVARSAVLVLYQPSCYPPHDYQSVDHRLLYLLHDYSRPKNYIWFNRDENDLLMDQYLSEESPCLSALYFRKGESVRAPTATWDGECDLLQWFWSHLSTQVRISNQYSQSINVVQENLGGGLASNTIEIPQDSEATIETYIGYLLHISDQLSMPTLLDAVMVTENLAEIVVSEKKLVDIQSIKNEDRDKYTVASTWVWSHGERHLRNAKQPLVVHNYTVKGYRKLPMPLDLYMSLYQFYNDQRNHSFAEFIDRLNGVHQNVGAKSPQMVELRPDMREAIVNVLQPQLEEWSKTKLFQTAVYGIREYYNGNVLHNHVDRIETHVISIILQIDQDRGGQEDWTLEVIDYNGRRQQVRLLPGEMLFYESAKLIHGRPKPFKGKRFANAFVHFAPVEGWDYRCDHKMFTSMMYGVIEPLENLHTDLTAAGNIIRVRDEL